MVGPGIWEHRCDTHSARYQHYLIDTCDIAGSSKWANDSCELATLSNLGYLRCASAHFLDNKRDCPVVRIAIGDRKRNPFSPLVRADNYKLAWLSPTSYKRGHDFEQMDLVCKIYAFLQLGVLHQMSTSEHLQIASTRKRQLYAIALRTVV